MECGIEFVGECSQNASNGIEINFHSSMWPIKKDLSKLVSTI